MPIPRFALAVFLSVICFTSHAQLLDSIQKHLSHKPKFLIKLDSRNSFIGSQSAPISGIKLGIDYDQSLRFGLGFNWINKGIIKRKILIDAKGEPYEARTALKLFYFSPFSEYVFFKDKRWEHAITLQLGLGKSWVNYYDNKGERFLENPKIILLYEPAMTTQYKVFPWIAIGGGIGYRLLLLNNRSSGANLNSPVYVVRLRLFFGELYRTIFKKNEKVQG